MSGFALPLVRFSVSQHRTIIGHCYSELPNEACGLLLGPAVGGDDLHDGEPTGAIADVVTTRNEAASARLYAIHGQDYGTARKAARESGNRIVGCFHSHTHTDAYPSPTDVEAAIHNPNWLYAIVSLRAETPMLHVFRMQSGNIAECQVVLEAR